jgi:hypothetical protein
MLSKREIRRLFRPGSWGHTNKGVPYHVGNSIRGLRWMRRIGKKRADRDTTRTIDGVWVNTHWDRPLTHGFHDPTGQWKRAQRVTDSTWAQVKVLRTKKGNYRINTTNTDLHEMGRLGYTTAAIDVKSWKNATNVEAFEDLKAMGEKHDVNIVCWVQRGNARVIPFARAAGIPTKRI